MHWIDWIIVVLYAFGALSLGWYFGRGQRRARDYFGGVMPSSLIGVSLFATLLSTISYLSIPGEVLGKGPVYLVHYLAYPLVFVLLGFVILPVYLRTPVTSAYELLEARLGLSLRLLGAVMFLALRVVWMSLLVFLTAQGIAAVTGLGPAWVPTIVVVTGSFAVVYTTLGGLRAVVVTDVLQTLLLFAGALLVIATISWELGGVQWFPTQWHGEIWDSQPLYSLDPSTRVTVLGTLLSMFFWMVCTSMGDQVSVQRFMATGSAVAARRALATQLCVGAVIGATLGLVGLALLGYLQMNPAALPPEIALKADADQLFPWFIGSHLPIVVTGLVVAGLFAAAMSSIDSGVNSITAVVLTDFIERLSAGSRNDATQFRYARLLALVIGGTVILLATSIGQIPGNFMAVTHKTVNLFTAPIAVLFFFALFVPFANSAGVWIGTLASVAVAVAIAFSRQLFGATHTGLDPVSFQWITPASMLTGVCVGSLACWAIRFFSHDMRQRQIDREDGGNPPSP